MYEYQDKCVVLRCIPNLLPGSPVEAVAVEWSTDYALLGGDGRRELVSVKHRDPGQHDWTIGRLRLRTSSAICMQSGVRWERPATSSSSRMRDSSQH